MSAEIVNLRRARKAKQRADSARKAAENRAVHGRTKQQRARKTTDRQRAERELDGARRTAPAAPGDENAT